MSAIWLDALGLTRHLSGVSDEGTSALSPLADGKRSRRWHAGDAAQGRVRADFMSGVRSGVNGTPTFFINGLHHNGSYDLEPLLAAVEAAMPERASQLSWAGA